MLTPKNMKTSIWSVETMSTASANGQNSIGTDNSQHSSSTSNISSSKTLSFKSTWRRKEKERIGIKNCWRNCMRGWWRHNPRVISIIGIRMSSRCLSRLTKNSIRQIMTILLPSLARKLRMRSKNTPHTSSKKRRTTNAWLRAWGQSSIIKLGSKGNKKTKHQSHCRSTTTSRLSLPTNQTTSQRIMTRPRQRRKKRTRREKTNRKNKRRKRRRQG